jgi:hypothetical protein
MNTFSSPLSLPAEMWADIEAAYQTPLRAYQVDSTMKCNFINAG